jgi:hypothetical protein
LKEGVEKSKIERPEMEVHDKEANAEDPNREYGQRPVRPLLDPKLPGEAEVRQHNLTHMPFRNWCPHCVRGRGKEMEHRRRKETEEPCMPEYHLDYCFPGDEDGQKLTVLVAIERHSKMKKSVVVPSKGSTGRYAARMVLELVEECGDKDRPITVKTDQEPAIKFLVDDICTARAGARTIKEEAPKRSTGVQRRRGKGGPDDGAVPQDLKISPGRADGG